MAKASASCSDDSENEGASVFALADIKMQKEITIVTTHFTTTSNKNNWIMHIHACTAIDLCVGSAVSFQDMELDQPKDIWQKFYSERRKRHYYYNVLTKKVRISSLLFLRLTPYIYIREPICVPYLQCVHRREWPFHVSAL